MTERLVQFDEPDELAELADDILIHLERLERDFPFFTDPGREVYVELKAQLMMEQFEPSSDETNLRRIYHGLRACVEDAAQELANVHALQARNPILNPELYLRKSFDGMAALFRERKKEDFNNERFTGMVEKIVLGKFVHALKSVPAEYELSLRKKIIAVLIGNDDEKARTEADIARLGFDELIAMLDLETLDLQFMVGDIDPVDCQRITRYRVMITILAARERIINDRDNSLRQAEAPLPTDLNSKPRHLHLVQPPTSA